MRIFVDIDDTICHSAIDGDYSTAQPDFARIGRINDLYVSGNTIIYWTARGTQTGIEWKDITERQLENWGVKYHELWFGKPVYDLFIDDKNINSSAFFSTDASGI